MRTEDDLRAALSTLERHAPTMAAVLPARPDRHPGHRLRSPKAISLLAAVTTAAALAGVVTALPLSVATSKKVPNGPAASSHHATTRTTLRTKLLTAFSAASGEIVYVHSLSTVTGGQTTAMDTWYYPWQAATGQQVRSRRLILNGDGTPYQDVEDIYFQPAPGTIPAGLPANVAAKLKAGRLVGAAAAIGEIIDVEYGNKTWSDQKDHWLLDSDPGSPAIVVYDIKNANWTVVGNTTLDGQPAIELSWTDADSTSYLWASASTDLPLREETTIHMTNPGGEITTTSTDDYELLPASPANIAKLTPPIPAGFRQTPTQVLPSTGPGLG